jgi:hypothetical protein
MAISTAMLQSKTCGKAHAVYTAAKVYERKSFVCIQDEGRALHACKVAHKPLFVWNKNFRSHQGQPMFAPCRASKPLRAICMQGFSLPAQVVCLHAKAVLRWCTGRVRSRMRCCLGEEMRAARVDPRAHIRISPQRGPSRRTCAAFTKKPQHEDMCRLY